ncbi:MAG: nucleotide exchange factor GrpE [Acidobacteriota bacterium]
MSSEHTPNGAADSSAAPDETLRRERDDFYDRLLRMTAEFDNYRKRVERERRELSEAAAADLIRDVLPVLDDLERALAVPHEAGPTAAAVANHQHGVELIRRQLAEVLRRRGVEQLEPVGQPFDPEWHESVGHDAADGRPDGEVTAEVRRGYRIGQRLLRPALVKVAKA